jgi:hypothetical protein
MHTRVLVGVLLLIGFIAAAEWACRRLVPTEPPKDKLGLFYDPIEDDPDAAPLIRQADREAREKSDRGPQMPLGQCHVFWAIKKRILKEKYGIDWKTPKEMNPKTAFD